ncbi:MAG: hypothetical protein ABWW70_01070 [Thermoproteota archaeon]
MSGVLLAPLAYLAAASGFCYLYPELASLLTLGLMDDPALCIKFHTGPAPLLAAAAGLLHVATSTELLGRRLAGSGLAVRTLYQAYRVVSWLLAATLLAVAAVHYAAG